MESILSLSAIASGIAPRMVAVGTPVALEIGQLLSAIVLEPAKAGKTKLLIQGTRVAATSAAPLQPGDQLSLRVARLAPVIHLKIVPDTTNPNLVRQQALLKVLPRQLPVVEVMNNLVTNVLPPVNKTPPGLQAAARTLLENAPRIENLTQPNTIHQTLLRSGHFFESRLARAVIAPGTATGWLNTDLKALFVRLRSALALSPPVTTTTRRASSVTTGNSAPVGSNASNATPAPAPLALMAPVPSKTPRPAPGHRTEVNAGAGTERIPALIQQVEGALARIQLNQLSSTPTPDQTIDRWYIEIPVLTDGRFHSVTLDIERDPGNQTRGASDAWTVSLSVDLGEAGWLHARLQLHGGELSTTLWAERASTAELVEQRLGRLAKALSASGLELNSIRCHHGRPVDSRGPRVNEPLLRVSA